MDKQNFSLRTYGPISPAVALMADVPQLLITTAETLAGITAPTLGELDILLAVLTAAPELTAVQLRPVWEALPTGGAGSQPRAYAARLLAAATDSDPDMGEALRRVRQGGGA